MMLCLCEKITTSTSYIPPDADHPPSGHLHVQDVVPANHRGLKLLLRSLRWWYSHTARSMALGITLSNFSFQFHAVKEGSREKRISVSCSVSKVASAIIIQQSLFKGPPSYRWEAPSHEGGFSYEPWGDTSCGVKPRRENKTQH